MRRTRRTAAAAGGALLVAGLVVGSGWPLYVAPRTPPPPTADEPVDVVVALGGNASTARLAVDLAEAGATGELLIAQPYRQWAPPPVDALCAAGATSSTPATDERPYAVTCFVPEPSTTRGEARYVAEVAERQDWDRIAVVAPTYQVSRAGFVMDRCVEDGLVLVESRPATTLLGWAYQYAYQTGGFARALLTQRGC